MPLFIAQETCEFTNNGAWSWFQDPRAIYYEGVYKKTYAAWVTNDGRVQIGSYNHEKGDIHVQTLIENFKVDDHSSPSLLVRKDGRILVAFSGHFNGPMRVRVSCYPEDISCFEPEAHFAEKATYANPYRVGDLIIMFFRDGMSWNTAMSVSSDNGSSWSAPHELIRRNGPRNRPYAKYAQDSAGGIHIAFTSGHPRNESQNKIYYVYFLENRFFKADGSLIKEFDGTNPIYIEGGEPELIYDANNGKGWIWDIALDEYEKPVILYATFPDDQNHHYHYAYWDGITWNHNGIVNSGGWFPQTPESESEKETNYSGGMALDSADTSIVYLSKQVKGVFEIFKYHTPDRGVTWKSIALTKNTPSGIMNVRPVVPRGNKLGSSTVLWMRGSYISYKKFQTAIMFYKQYETMALKNINQSIIRSNRNLVMNQDLTPHLNEEDFKKFDAEVAKCSCYLEYGIGGSTLHAATRKKGLPIITQDSDPAWVLRMKEALSSYNNIIFNHTDIGEVKEWGIPQYIDNISNFYQYPIKPWESALSENAEPDLVLIDGRFRVACFLYSIFVSKIGTTILFDDFNNRPHYHIAAEFEDIQSSHDRMVVFRKTRQPDNRKLIEYFSKYSIDFR